MLFHWLSGMAWPVGAKDASSQHALLKLTKDRSSPLHGYTTMKIAVDWLKQYCPVNLTTSSIAELLTGCGLEVEAIHRYESVPGSLQNLLVGEVIEKKKHPNGDRLSICRVNTGNDIYQIICGAPNVAEGQKVAVALPGTVLHPCEGTPFTIERITIRGEVSEGMICSEAEMGLGPDKDGILVLPPDAVTGMPLTHYYKEILFSDDVLEIGLTPNRGDAASHIGIARDLAAAINYRHPRPDHPPVQLRLPSLKSYEDAYPCPVKISIENQSDCLRYSGIFIDKVAVKPSPNWLQHRLLSVGLKPINNVVDVVNFVMYEMGQPLHAFDADQIAGQHIIVKNLPAGTSFTTLDGKQRKLNGQELMICDEQEGLCMAGVFGGFHSGVTQTTTSVFIESACFHPAAVRRTSRLHALFTDASFRFERGADPDLTLPALLRAAQLIEEIAGGQVSAPRDVYPKPVQPVEITFRPDQACQLMGLHLRDDYMADVLTSLGFIIKKKNDTEWNITVPLNKSGMHYQADLEEEILRIYGYDNVPFPEKMNMPFVVGDTRAEELFLEKASAFLVANGFMEILNNSMVALRQDDTKQLKIINPASPEMSGLRTEMITSGLNTIRYNLNRQNDRLRLFETGRVYHLQSDGITETETLSLFLTGHRHEASWIKMLPDRYDLFTLKSILIQLMRYTGLPVENLMIREAADELFACCFHLLINDCLIGRMGYLAPSLLQSMDIHSEVLAAELNVRACSEQASQQKIVHEPPLFPVVKRDLALLLDETVRYEQLQRVALHTLPQWLEKMILFDIYRGEGIPQGKVSMAISFYLRDREKTLSDTEIESAMTQLANAFEAKVHAIIRK
jgi:phenylalanyl-tRNA synthetase beta chain